MSPLGAPPALPPAPYRLYVLCGSVPLIREWRDTRGITAAQTVEVTSGQHERRLRGCNGQGVAIVQLAGTPQAPDVLHSLAILRSRGAVDLDDLWWPPGVPDTRDQRIEVRSFGGDDPVRVLTVPQQPVDGQ